MVGVPHFRLPLNLPHAGTIAVRISYHLQRIMPGGEEPQAARQLLNLLLPFRDLDSNPPPEEAAPVVEEAAELARQIVAAMERERVGDDRLGQVIRNLFECLEKGEEGAIISLRAGENPDSMLRPR
ncbi:MAG: hypothetical protein ACYTAF_07030 [Planctomycetota bacterium]|jgi:hypothetical protein